MWQVKCPVVQAFRFVKDKAKLSSQVNVRMQTIETLCLGVYIYISYYVCTIYMIHNIVIYTYMYINIPVNNCICICIYIYVYI